MSDINVDEILSEAAKATSGKTRTPKASAGETSGVAPKERKPREPKEPKEKLYVQWNEDGSPMLDAEGNRVKLPTKMERPKKPRAEGSGSRARVLPSNGSSTISWVEEKVAKYKGARAEYASMRSEGQTIDSYVAAGGDKGFLRFYVRDGAATVTEPSA